MGTKSDDLFGAETEPERYQLVQELASGGMATVFLARTRDPQGASQLVAVKRIHRHLAREQSFVEMFFDEARIAAQIRHPNVCTLFDFGRSGPVFYIAMEYILGETLLELIRVAARNPQLRDSLDWQVHAAAIVADACEGLHAVHELTDDQGQPMGVVHRDISPNNVFVTYDGGVKVVDFGIAYAQNKMHHTRTGVMKGKVGYMPPELIVGDGRDVDRRADIWALGVCLWELLAGALLFRGHNDAATMMNVMQRPIPSLRSVAGVPAALDEIVARALERDRTGRYPTARALGRDLRSWIASTGEKVDEAEIADFVRARFPGQYVRKLDALEAARTATGAVDLGALSDDLLTRQLPLGSPAAPNQDTAELMQAGSGDLLLLPPSTGSGVGKSAAPSIPPPPRSRRGRWAAFSVAICAAVLAVGGTGLALWQQEHGDAPDVPALAVASRKPSALPVEDTRPVPGELSAAPVPPAPTPEAPTSPEPTVEPPVEPAVEPPVEPVTATDDPHPAEPTDGEATAPSEKDDDDRSGRRKRPRERSRVRPKRRDGEPRRPTDPEPDAEADLPDPIDEPAADPEPPVTRPVPVPDPGPVTPPPVAPPRRTGPLAASVSVAALEVHGSLVNSMVSRAIERVTPSLKACYRDAAVAAGKNSRCTVRVTLSINETGQVSRVTAAGAQLAGLDACVKRAAMKIRTLTRPDVGGATASFEVKYKPQGE